MNVFDLFARLSLNSDSFISGLRDAEGESEKSSEKIKGIWSGAGKAIAGALVAAGAGIAKITQSATDAYSNYQQLVGGVETLFGTGGKSLEQYAEWVGESVDTVRQKYESLENAQAYMMERAANAYATAGMSANTYMETATSFAAALVSGLGGDTETAAVMADKAITDMSDNANKMGTSLESIQNAYQGFAKQNFTMLDNLKLGYGGTQGEMVRLINDSGILEDKITDLDGITFDQMIEAIHQVQVNLGITGTTAEEAGKTISGSAGSMTAAWENLLIGLGDANADLQQLIDNLVASFNVMVENVVPTIENVLGSLPSAFGAIANAFEQLAPSLIDTATSFVTIAADMVINLINMLVDTVGSLAPMLADSLIGILTDGVTEVLGKLPLLVDAGTQMISALAKGLSENAPKLIQAALNSVLTIAEAIVDNLDELIDAAISLIEALIEGLMSPESITIIIEGVSRVIGKIGDQILVNIPKIWEMGRNVAGAIIDGISNYPWATEIKSVNQMLQDIGASMHQALLRGYNQQMVAGYSDFISSFENMTSEEVEALANTMQNNVVEMNKAFDAYVDSDFYSYDTLEGVQNYISNWLGRDGDEGRFAVLLNTALQKSQAENISFDTAMNNLVEDWQNKADIATDAYVKGTYQIGSAASTAATEIAYAGKMAGQEATSTTAETSDEPSSVFGDMEKAYQDAVDALDKKKALHQEGMNEDANYYAALQKINAEYSEWVSGSSEEYWKNFDKVSNYYEKATKESSKTAKSSATDTTKAYEDAFNKEIDAHELAVAAGKETEEQYYAWLEGYLADHVNTESNLYVSMYKKLGTFRKKEAEDAARAEKKAAEDAQKQREKDAKTTYAALKKYADDYKTKIQNIQTEMDKLARGLGGSFMDKYTFEKDDKTGKTKVTQNKKFLIEQQKNLEKYYNGIAALKKRGVSDVLLNQLQGLDMEQGIALVEMWTKQSDTYLGNIAKRYENVEKVQNDIAQMLYSDEIDAATSSTMENMKDSLLNSGIDFKEVGELITSEIAEGMQSDTSAGLVRDSMSGIWDYASGLVSGNIPMIEVSQSAESPAVVAANAGTTDASAANENKKKTKNTSNTTSAARGGGAVTLNMAIDSFNNYTEDDLEKLVSLIGEKLYTYIAGKEMAAV